MRYQSLGRVRRESTWGGREADIKGELPQGYGSNKKIHP